MSQELGTVKRGRYKMIRKVKTKAHRLTNRRGRKKKSERGIKVINGKKPRGPEPQTLDV